MEKNKRIGSFISSLLQREEKTEEKRIYFTNVFGLIAIFACLPYIFVYSYYGHYSISFSILIFVAAFLLGWFLNKVGYHETAKFILVLSANTAIALYALFLGKDSGIYVLFIAVTAASAIVYTVANRKMLFFHLGTSLFFFFLLQLPFVQSIFYIPTISEDNVYIIFLISFVIGILVVFICNYQQNVTNTEVENTLKRSETNLTVLFESTIQAFILLGRNCRVLAFNNKAGNVAIAFWNRTIEVGMPFSFEKDASEAEQFFWETFHNALNGISSRREREIKIPNRESVFHQIEYSPAYDKKGEIYGVLLSVIDITDRIKYERELNAAKLQAEEAVKVKSDFLSNMSHEMRTPLNAIIGFSDLLLETQMDKSSLENLQSIKYSSENLLVLINDILDLSKIEAGKLSIENTDFNLKYLLEQSIQLIQVKAIEKNVKLVFDLDESIPEQLVGDPVRLNQILLNLTSNAVKFTNQGFVSVVVKCVKSDNRNILVRFEVKDTGIGIRNEKLPFIFDSFTQAETYITRKYGGTGLGLSITKKLINLLGGSIHVLSKEYSGTTFTVDVPFWISNKKLENVKEEDDVYASFKGEKILLVEDNIFNQVLICKVLQKWEIEIDIANNGIEAIVLLQKKKYNLVLMDMQMPEMNGVEATKHIRDMDTDVMDHNISIIGISADAYSESKEKALKSGMNDYITKPFRQKELYKLLLQYLGSSHTIRIDKTEEERQLQDHRQSLNIAYLKETFPDESDIKTLLSIYFSSTTDGIAKMLNAYESGNMDELYQAAHKLKSAFTTIGYFNTVKMLKAIEKKTKHNDNYAILGNMVAMVQADFKRSVEEVNAILIR
jgi:signal transduction histidine kinase/DNA-binding NarL/FixJ family response regulator